MRIAVIFVVRTCPDVELCAAVEAVVLVEGVQLYHLLIVSAPPNHNQCHQYEK